MQEEQNELEVSNKKEAVKAFLKDTYNTDIRHQFHKLKSK